MNNQLSVLRRSNSKMISVLKELRLKSFTITDLIKLVFFNSNKYNVEI